MNCQGFLLPFLVAWLNKLVHAEMLDYSIPGEQCGYIIERGNQYRIMTAVEGDPPTYPDNVNCVIGFRTDASMKFFLRILSMDLEFSSQCANDALLIYDGVTDADPLLIGHGYGICGDSLSLPNYYKSTGNEISIKFVTNSADNQGKGFKLVLTPYEQANNETSTCDNSDDFMCLGDLKCMIRDVECNGETQCADGSDEPSNCLSRSSAGVQVGSFALVLLLASFAAMRTFRSGIP
ncbi:procollagen C-endopeptidase enhancer 1-like [Ptychodera flava]|uniref:procollagen C-endopeptidase enhancer 1-like n=1 Tax=Ptychodera flava TaxID=63121 RepID=UPI003969E0BF